MGPPVAVVVGSTIIGLGLAAAFHEFAWPHIRPHAQELVSHCKARLHHTFRGLRRHSAQRYSSSLYGPDGDDKCPNAPSPFSDTLYEGSYTPLIVVRSAGNETNQRSVHRRRIVGQALTHAVHLDAGAEMAQLDKADPLVAYVPMSPSCSLAVSRLAMPSDLAVPDPFEEPSVHVASAIPLPLSASAIRDYKPSGVPEAFVIRADSPTQTPSSPTPPNHPTPESSTNLSTSSPCYSRSPARRSQQLMTSLTIPSIGSLSPPTRPIGTTSEPFTRATSPSGMSDSLSLVSAALSRTWTEGGTTDIFSDDEQDFQTAEADPDDDVRSISESGSWESVSAAGRADSPSTTRR